MLGIKKKDFKTHPPQTWKQILQEKLMWLVLKIWNSPTPNPFNTKNLTHQYTPSSLSPHTFKS